MAASGRSRIRCAGLPLTTARGFAGRPKMFRALPDALSFCTPEQRGMTGRANAPVREAFHWPWWWRSVRDPSDLSDTDTVGMVAAANVSPHTRERPAVGRKDDACRKPSPIRCRHERFPVSADPLSRPRSCPNPLIFSIVGFGRKGRAVTVSVAIPVGKVANPVWAERSRRYFSR